MTPRSNGADSAGAEPASERLDDYAVTCELMSTLVADPPDDELRATLAASPSWPLPLDPGTRLGLYLLRQWARSGTPEAAHEDHRRLFEAPAPEPGDHLGEELGAIAALAQRGRDERKDHGDVATACLDQIGDLACERVLPRAEDLADRIGEHAATDLYRGYAHLLRALTRDLAEHFAA